MLNGPDGVSSLTSLGQLRRYLTTPPLGQRAGYETARRVLKVLRLTGWITLVGVQRDPITGKVMSERYRVHERLIRHALPTRRLPAYCRRAFTRRAIRSSGLRSISIMRSSKSSAVTMGRLALVILGALAPRRYRWGLA